MKTESQLQPLAPGFSLTPHRPVFQPGQGPSTIGEAYRPISRNDDGSQQTYMDIIADQKRVEEVSKKFLLD